jgi:hypothetical protein
LCKETEKAVNQRIQEFFTPHNIVSIPVNELAQALRGDSTDDLARHALIDQADETKPVQHCTGSSGRSRTSTAISSTS